MAHAIEYVKLKKGSDITLISISGPNENHVKDIRERIEICFNKLRGNSYESDIFSFLHGMSKK